MTVLPHSVQALYDHYRVYRGCYKNVSHSAHPLQPDAKSMLDSLSQLPAFIWKLAVMWKPTPCMKLFLP